MEESPIIFSGAMVRAILAGQKTQTRRAIKPNKQHPEVDPHGIYELHPGDIERARCPYGGVGDHLWVRENFKILSASEGYSSGFTDDWECGRAKIQYMADGHQQDSGDLIVRDDGVDEGKQAVRFCNRHLVVPSIHMPRWASRLTLEVTDIRIESLQAITDQDAMAEGCSGLLEDGARSSADRFSDLWKHINGEDSWNENPWVWAISFNVITPQLKRD